ncbi:MAG: hypothetical protein JO237_07875 [Pseudolabrys sp.]|nr:hypothetical protein [Pseudolabrys sp.]
MARTRRATAIAAASYIEWSPVIAGAIGAAAISFLLLTFGASIGLTLTSPWPNSGVSTWAVVLAVGWWTVIVAIGSLFAGGYLAGRMRSSWADGDAAESGFRDSTHGFLVWALSVLLGALLLAFTAGTAAKTGTQAVSTVAAGAISGTNTEGLGTSPIDYAVDTLLRSPRATTTGQGDNRGARDEARRIFASTIKNRELTAADRDYLVDLVAARTGVSAADARTRVDQSVTQARDLEIKARQAADTARKSGIIAGFLTGASLLIGLAAAAGGARLGGVHRDEGTEAHLFGTRFW